MDLQKSTLHYQTIRFDRSTFNRDYLLMFPSPHLPMGFKIPGSLSEFAHGWYWKINLCLLCQSTLKNPWNHQSQRWYDTKSARNIVKPIISRRFTYGNPQYHSYYPKNAQWILPNIMNTTKNSTRNWDPSIILTCIPPTLRQWRAGKCTIFISDFPIFLWKPPIDRVFFPASHVWWHQRVNPIKSH